MRWCLGGPEWACKENASPGQEMAHLGSPGYRANKHPVMGWSKEGKDPAPDPAVESEKLIIVRRTEMHPMVIEPSGTRLLGKEATSTYQAALCNVGFGRSVSVVPNGPLELEAGRDSNLQARGQANSQLPE